MRKKRLEELTLKNNFMFAAVMMEPSNCKGFLEMTLGITIDRVVVSREKSIVYHPEYKGVRLDVYACDDKERCFNVEMQTLRKAVLGRRGRYYQSQMDMELLLEGEYYTELPNTYVIFICDFDPFGQKKFCYTFYTKCQESETTELDDGRCLIFLSTCGENEREVSKDLVTFLKFVKSDLKKSQEDFQDDYVAQLQEYIQQIKESREMGERFMILEEMLQEERAGGHAEGKEEGKVQAKTEDIIEILSEHGAVPEELQERIMNERDLNVLSGWLKKAVRAESIEAFSDQM